MVKIIGAALSVVVNTLPVELEVSMAGIDSNGGRSHAGHGTLQRGLITLLDVDEAVVNATDVGCFELALVPVRGKVGVTLLKQDKVFKRLRQYDD